MVVTADSMTYRELREEWTPVKLVEVHNVLYSEWLMETKPACVSFKGTGCTKFDGPGSYVVLDFGKELCGGIRMITIEENDVCRRLLSKLSPYLQVDTVQKPIRAFQVLAGRNAESDAAMLQEGGAQGFSFKEYKFWSSRVHTT